MCSQAVSVTTSKRSPNGEAIKRRNASRGAVRSMKIDNAELSDALLASKLVPSGSNISKCVVPKCSIEADQVSTALPSAQTTPEMNCLPSDEDAWPSMREATCGWDFCSEASDLDDWEALPEPSVPLEPVVQNERAQKTYAEAMKTNTYADGNFKSPPFHGEISPPTYRLEVRKASASQKSPRCEDLDEDCDALPILGKDCRWHGWTKDHKRNRNAKVQRKVDDRMAKRIEQSVQNRGWTEKAGSDEE